MVNTSVENSHITPGFKKLGVILIGVLLIAMLVIVFLYMRENFKSNKYSSRELPTDSFYKMQIKNYLLGVKADCKNIWI